jgi:two-component system, LytTR family, response regulator
MRRPTDLPYPAAVLDLRPTVQAARRHEDLPGSIDPRSGYLARIAVRSLNRIVIVQVADIVRLEAEDNYVRIWADRPYLHKETLTRLTERLDPAIFLRVHRSHTVNIRVVRELRPQLHGEYVLVLRDGTEITSGRSFRSRIQQAFGLGRASADDDA